MNLESKVMTGVANIVGFIKQQVKNDLVAQVRLGNVSEINEEQLRKICLILESSIEASFTKSANEVTSVLREVQFKTK